MKRLAIPLSLLLLLLQGCERQPSQQVVKDEEWDNEAEVIFQTGEVLKKIKSDNELRLQEERERLQDRPSDNSNTEKSNTNTGILPQRE